MLTAGPVLGLDGRRPQAARPAAGPQRLIAVGRIRFEPVGPLPTRLLAERGAELGQPRVHGRNPQRTAGAALVAGVLDVVVGGVDLARPGQRVLTAHVVTAEPARVHLPRAQAGPAVDDPLRYQATHAARPGQP